MLNLNFLDAPGGPSLDLPEEGLEQAVDLLEGEKSFAHPRFTLPAVSDVSPVITIQRFL